MVRIAGMLFEANLDCYGEYIDLTIQDELTEEQIQAIKNATILERVIMEYGQETNIVTVYNLLGWKKVEKVRYGMQFTFQTYHLTDVDQLKQDNEDLTQAVLELAAIIGGGE